MDEKRVACSTHTCVIHRFELQEMPTLLRGVAPEDYTMHCDQKRREQSRETGSVFASGKGIRVVD